MENQQASANHGKTPEIWFGGSNEPAATACPTAMWRPWTERSAFHLQADGQDPSPWYEMVVE